ncbi:MAG: iron-sulfur cluster biosynthesis family protein [Lactobacillus sp.]|nr:iron-sulfur cluster biosynthesis family protein [Lactobacillus sp.]
MTVSMNIKPEALKILQKNDAKVVLLSLNDGSNKYSKVGGTCSIGANFQFVMMDETDPEYDIKIENNAGLNLWTSKPEMTFLSDNLVVDAKNSVLTLSDDSGIIDGAMTVQKYTGPVEVTKSDIKSAKTC